MIPISIFVGGEIMFDASGAFYSIPAAFYFPAGNNITLDEVKRRIYQYIGKNDRQVSLKIKARYNVGSIGAVYYELYPIEDDAMLLMFIENAMSGSNLRKIELFVETTVNSRELDDQNEYYSNVASIPGSSNQTVDYFNSGPLFTLNDFGLNEVIYDEVGGNESECEYENEDDNENGDDVVEGEEELVESEWNAEWERENIEGNNSSENEFEEPTRSYHNPYVNRPEYIYW